MFLHFIDFLKLKDIHLDTYSSTYRQFSVYRDDTNIKLKAALFVLGMCILSDSVHIVPLAWEKLATKGAIPDQGIHVYRSGCGVVDRPIPL